jgi:hypothetical protein
MKTTNLTILTALILGVSLFAADDSTLDKVLGDVQKRERAVRDKQEEQQRQDRDAAERKRRLEEKTRLADEQAKVNRKALFERDYGKYSAIKASPQASANDIALAWKTICEKWFGDFKDSYPVDLEWSPEAGGPSPATLKDMVILIAGTDPKLLENNAFKSQMTRILSRTYRISKNSALVFSGSISIKDNELVTGVLLPSECPFCGRV